ncbi:unnamed protein product [Spirodela intermedia]|uniref:non-specific serine/threonine protein kinase n=1 Tax=Spirodela intermedia TaxID=51605 RepID=A0A7I8IY27_SPIIN|nr:unnamed protein product [Spirodela intermedia]CAA6662063.1 unnamed protein product [Spirodela intermedia]
MSTSLVAILGGSAAGLVLLAVAIGLVWLYLLRHENASNKNSDTGSSDPPPPAEWNRVGRASSTGCEALTDPQGARRFSLEELEKATKSFSKANLVGEGSFGSVYKGLLADGIIVAIKKVREFQGRNIQHLSEIWHRNLVTLIGHCFERGLQLLVYEYVPNGSVTSHLYDHGHEQKAQLEFKQRLSIALGAAKVDENFIAKVADAGIIDLLRETGCGSPQILGSNVFQDPEVGDSAQLSEMDDVYSFGVFILELIMGREISSLSFLESNEGLTKWDGLKLNSSELIDRRLGNSFTSEGMKWLIELALQCLDSPGVRRPKMDAVVLELDRILETEMTLTMVMGDGTTTVTLGSQLFTSS